MSDIIEAIEGLVSAGHTFQIGPKPNSTNLDPVVANISGPSGSRTTYGRSVSEAVSALCVAIALARMESVSLTPDDQFTLS